MSLSDSLLNPAGNRTPAGGPGGPEGSVDDRGGTATTAGDRELAAREIARFLDGRRPDLVFFFGYGDGAWVEALREHTSAPVLVCEPRPGELAAARRSALPPGVQVFGGAGELAAAAGRIPDLASRQVVAGAIPDLRAGEPAMFARFTAAVRQALVDARIRGVTHLRVAETWLRHLATNLPVLATLPPVEVLAGRFAGSPGLVIGAGPSLDRNLETLRALQDRVVLCAVSTALPALARAGITPHLVVAIEANDLSCHFAGVPHLERMTLLPGPQGHPAHFALPVGRRLALAARGSAAGDWLEHAWGCRQLESGGSVACVAFSVLHHLGCDPLVLAGMDLALTDGRTHATGAVQSSRRHVFDAAARRVVFTSAEGPAGGSWQAEAVEAWGGGAQVPTRPVLSSYRLWFEAAAETWAADRALVNATEGGARIHGFREATLADWARERAPSPLAVEAIIAAAVDRAPATDGAALRREVAAELATVARAAAAAGRAAGLAERALQDLEAGRRRGLEARLARLAAAEAELATCTRATRLLNALVGERALAQARGDARPPAGDAAATTAWSLRQSGRICGLIADGARELAALYGPLVDGSGNPTGPAA